MLYPQNGDRIVAVHFVTSFQPMYTNDLFAQFTPRARRDKTVGSASCRGRAWRCERASDDYGEYGKSAGVVA